MTVIDALADSAVLDEFLSDLDECAPGTLLMAVDLRTRIRIVQAEVRSKHRRRAAITAAACQATVLLIAVGVLLGGG